ncbi:uncharacterized protein LOC115210846 [Octopus sinensis]|uniref:Uncharacterized protein LOC115210846 n=1 Tax=Octopus sinensis TaxID=2607531 RepID=A0A6P7SBU5_9MOLL|nr:uncharacterized protein LOC115210846 [Octopus sinensis]
MVGCSAPNCSNRAAKGGYKMKRFPADPAIRQIWINNVKRADWNWNPPANFRNCRLCEVHFDDSQFEYKHTPEGTGRCLKPGAIPTLFDMQSGTICQSNLTNLHTSQSRRHKKIVGEFNPILCLSNLEQRNHQLPGLSKHTSISTNIFNATSSHNIIDMNFFKKKQTEKIVNSLPITSYIDEQTNFSQFSNQIQYNYHRKPQASSSNDTLTFPSKRMESIHQPNLSLSTNESVASMLPVPSHHLLHTESPNVNLQPLLQPGEIKVEYVEDSSQNSERSIGEQVKTISPHLSSPKLHTVKLSSENIQNSLLQDQAETSEMYPQTHLGNLSSLMSHESKEPRNYPSNTTLIKDIEIESNASKDEEDLQFQRLSDQSDVGIKKDTVKTVKSHFSPTISLHSNSIYNQGLQYSSQSNVTKVETSILKSPVTTPDVLVNEIESKHLYYFHMSSDSRIQTSEPNEDISQQDLECHRLVRGAQNLENNESFNNRVDIRNIGPCYTPISESVSTSPRVTKYHERISPNIMQKRDKQLPKSRINHKLVSVENLHRKLKEEKRKCQKLRLENQKLRKQLGPLRNLQNWINRLLNTNESNQFEELNFRENSTDTLQKALKLCSTVCGYLSNVVSLPFYSNITRSI